MIFTAPKFVCLKYAPYSMAPVVSDLAVQTDPRGGWTGIISCHQVMCTLRLLSRDRVVNIASSRLLCTCNTVHAMIWFMQLAPPQRSIRRWEDGVSSQGLDTERMNEATNTASTCEECCEESSTHTFITINWVGCTFNYVVPSFPVFSAMLTHYYEIQPWRWWKCVWWLF